MMCEGFTRLNPSHISSLAGRKLYPDPNQALAHDVIRSLNEDDTSPLHGEIKMLGTGRGRVSQAPLAEEIVDFLETVEKIGSGGKLQELRGGAKRFFLNYIKALSTTFPSAWAGRKYSIKTGAALRAFIRAAPDVMARARELRRDPFDLNAIREAIKPWGERLRDRRFETEGEWKLKLAGGTRGTVEVLTRELGDAVVGPISLLLERHVLVRRRPGVRVDLHQGRVPHARPDPARPDIFPDRAEPHPLVEELLDLVKHRLALLPVRLPRLLPVERLDVGIGAARERSFDRHELGHPRGRVAVRRVDA